MMSTQTACDLHGLRILVVEDMLLIADLIVDELQENGCLIIGPAPRLAQGLAMATTERLDGALLDINLAGEQCFPIAAALAERGVPFAFLTGYGDAVVPPQFKGAPCLAKPFDLRALAPLVGGFVSRPGGATHS